MDASEETHLQQVAGRLADEFGQDRSRVERQVLGAADRWRHARVRTFVPIMVERRVRGQLQQRHLQS
jgi:hypothetical protein